MNIGKAIRIILATQANLNMSYRHENVVSKARKRRFNNDRALIHHSYIYLIERIEGRMIHAYEDLRKEVKIHKDANDFLLKQLEYKEAA